MKPLYEVPKEYEDLLDYVEEYDLVPDYLEVVGSDEETQVQKAINLGLSIKNLEHLLSGIEKSIEDMEKRKIKIMKSIENIKHYILHHVNISELNKDDLNLPNLRISFRKNNYSLHIEDQSFIPQHYYTEKVTSHLSKRSIIEDLKSGVEIPGAWFKTETYVIVK